MTTGGADYPVSFEVDYPESSSRWRALLGVLFLLKAVLLIPHLVILFFLWIAAVVVTYVGYWAVLITGQYPRGLFGFITGVQRWNSRTDSWMYGLTDRYPSFSLSERDYPVAFEIEYPEASSRWRALLGALLFAKALLLIPHMIILYGLGIALLAAVYVGYWIALITGSYPSELFAFVSGVQRWEYRTTSWLVGLTDRYAPFGLE